MIKGMTATEYAAYRDFQKRQDELNNQIKLLRAELDGIVSQMFDMLIAAHERSSQFKLGDVIEFQKAIGLIYPPKKYQTRRVVLFKYRWGWGNEVCAIWETIKQDMTMSAARRSNWINDLEMATAKKIGTWDFETQKFVPLEK